jgi:hypothetical protein
VSYNASSDSERAALEAAPRGGVPANWGESRTPSTRLGNKLLDRIIRYTQSTPRKKGLVVLLPVVLEPDREVLHGDALLADRPPAVPRDLYERVERDLDLRRVSTFATD